MGAGAPAVPAVGYGGMHLSLEDRPPEADAIRRHARRASTPA